ncbi:MAG: formylglycine-generating enzyme family protein [Gammaproteobacteria bacterium]|nr:formylglycine-generating enzyme family protein [Gammaproteobacteria bacterium]
MKCLLSVFLSILSVVAVTDSIGGEANDPLVPPKDHFHRTDHRNEQCLNCHAGDERLTSSSAFSVVRTKCNVCHASDSVAGVVINNTDVNAAKNPVTNSARRDRFTKLAQSEKQQQASQQVPPLQILNLKIDPSLAKIKLPANAGMQFPMYYKNSRVGARPNKMVLIPAGEFIMGSDARLPDEGPQYTVDLPAYYIDIYEVTNLQYEKFNNETKRRSPRHFRNRTFPEGKVDHPVTYVSWEDANAYCQWAGKRLPTDKEWEKAARGNDARIFPWGNVFDVKKANTPLRWQQVAAFGDTTPVGAFADGVSVFGLYDMSGNVWEWTASWYKAYPGNKVPSESYGEFYKTLKGGSWFDCSFYNCGISAPVFNRAFFAVRTKNDSFGFRCAKDADAPATKSKATN